MYVDPQKARQERERQERERQARIKAEKERKAKLEAEKERQAKLKADRERRERIKAEKEAAKKAEHPDKKAAPKVNPEIAKGNPGEPASIYSSNSPITKPATKPQAPLNRNARTWSGETPDPTRNPQAPTEDQQRLLKVQESEQAAQSIWKNSPANTAQLNLPYKSQLSATAATQSRTQPSSYYEQWQNAAQSQIGLGNPKGIEQYFNENRKSLKTLDWLLQTNLNPELQDQNPELNITRAAGRGAYTDRTNYYKTEYQDYLTPPKDLSRERVQLAALKKGTLEQLTGKAPTNGVEIVRQIITKDEKGQPQSTFYTKSKDGWVPLSGIKPEQIIVTVNAPQTEGQQPGTLGSTVNIAGAEQHTRKQYNTINQNYQTYINPTFTQYQQLRGDTPRQLSGSNLRNEIGVAMNFTPNNAPLSETDQKALQTGNWDLFSPDKISPELAQSMSPAQQEKLKSQLKEQHEALTKIEGKVKEIGGDNAKVTTLPIMVDSPDIGGVMQVPLFRVAGKDGKDRFIDNTGRTYDNFQDWKDNNKLPAGRVSYFAEGQISSNKDGKPNIVTEKTHAVIDTPWEHIKQVGDWVATGVGVAVGVVAIGALILGTGGLATPLVVAGAGAALWGAGSAAGKLHDRSSHGESLSLADAEARSAWIELAANGVGFAAIGSSIRAGGAISKVMSTADEAGMLTASARQVNQASNLARTSQVLNGASSATDGVALADSTYGLAKGWDKLSPEQRLMAIGQIGFWGGMMAHGSREAMGNNFYASKDVDAFMHGVAAKPKENLTNPNLGATPDSRPVVERVQGAVRKGFNVSEADARVLGGMNGDGAVPIELSPELKQQLGIYGKNPTNEDVLRGLKTIENKQQEGLNPTKAEEVLTKAEKTKTQETVPKTQDPTPKTSAPKAEGDKFEPENFPTPELILKSNDPRKQSPLAEFAKKMSAGANDFKAEFSDVLSSSKAKTPQEREALLEDAYQWWIKKRYGMLKSDEKLLNDIQPGDPNRDPFGKIGGLLDKGMPTPAYRTRDEMGSLISERFRGLGDNVEVLDNPVTLPQWVADELGLKSVDVLGNRLIRGKAADEIDLQRQPPAKPLEKQYGYDPGAEKFISETGDPKNQKILHDAGIKVFSRLLEQGATLKDPQSLKQFSEAAYFFFQGPIKNRGSDSVIRGYVSSIGEQLSGKPITLPHDVDIQAYARSQQDFTQWLTKRIQGSDDRTVGGVEPKTGSGDSKIDDLKGKDIDLKSKSINSGKDGAIPTTLGEQPKS